MPRIHCLATIAGAALLSTGCSSPELRRFTSFPSAANVYVNGVQYGQTPCDVQVDFDKFPRTRIVIFTANHLPWEQEYNRERFLALDKNGTEATLPEEPR